MKKSHGIAILASFALVSGIIGGCTWQANREDAADDALFTQVKKELAAGKTGDAERDMWKIQDISRRKGDYKDLKEDIDHAKSEDEFAAAVKDYAAGRNGRAASRLTYGIIGKIKEFEGYKDICQEVETALIADTEKALKDRQLEIVRSNLWSADELGKFTGEEKDQEFTPDPKQTAKLQQLHAGLDDAYFAKAKKELTEKHYQAAYDALIAVDDKKRFADYQAVRHAAIVNGIIEYYTHR